MDKLGFINECFYKTLGAREQYFDNEDSTWINYNPFYGYSSGYNPFESFKDLLSVYNITLESYEGEFAFDDNFVEYVIDGEKYLSHIQDYRDEYTGLILLQYDRLKKEEDLINE